MRAYLELLSMPGVKRLVVSTLPGRMAYSMITLATYFFVHETTGSITIAGLATGAETIASSLTAGLRGHAIDRFGQTRPLSFFIPAWVVMLVALSQVDSAFAIIFVSALIGLSSPPINLSARPLWRAAVGADHLRTAYALDTTMMNATTVIGPVIATYVALNIGAQQELWLTAAFMLIGGIAMITMPLSRNWIPEPNEGSAFSVLRDPRFRILALEGAIFGLGWGLLEIAIPSISTTINRPELSAPLVATLATASIVGGLIIGGRKNSVTPLRGFKLSSLFVTVSAAPLAFTHPGWSMGVVLAGIGLAIGFAMVYHWEVVEAVRPLGSATSAQAWLWTVEGTTLALGTALGAYVVDHVSPQLALAGVSLALATSAVFIWTYAAPRLLEADRPLSEIEKSEAIADLESTNE